MGESEKIEHYISSGNVYADLGFENAEEMKAKSRLVSEIGSVMERRGIGDAEVAAVLDIQPSEVYDVRCGDFEDIPIETLQKGLQRLTDSAGGGAWSGGVRGGTPLAAAGIGER